MGASFTRIPATRYPLSDIAADFGAEFVDGAVAAVRPQTRSVLLDGGGELEYEALVLALGARREPAFAAAITLGQEGAPDALHQLIADLARSRVRRVAFVAPADTAWTLPLYELALMTARAAPAKRNDRARLSLVTPESRPLAIFGPSIGAEIAALLASAGIEFIGSTRAQSRRTSLHLEPNGRALDADRVVALPVLRGRAPTGVPADSSGFIETDLHGRVAGLAGVFAAGDATAFPVKQGGLAAQQADAVAEAVAAHLGSPLAPHPFKPVLRGLLYTGGAERFLRAGLGGAGQRGMAAAHPLWWPPAKVAGRYLARYLLARDSGEPAGPPPGGFTHVAAALNAL